MTRKQQNDKALMTAIQNYLHEGGTVKVVLGFVAILVALWGYFGFDDRLDEQGDRLEAVEAALDKRFDRLAQRATDLETKERNLNDAIARAVERGIRRGVVQTLRIVNEP